MGKYFIYYGALLIILLTFIIFFFHDPTQKEERIKEKIIIPQNAKPNPETNPAICEKTSYFNEIFEVYLLNLYNKKERRLRSSKKLYDMKINFHWIESVDSRNIKGSSMYEKYLKDVPEFDPEKIKTGHLGIILSFLKIYEIVSEMKSPKKFLMVFEDDLEFTSNSFKGKEKFS